MTLNWSLDWSYYELWKTNLASTTVNLYFSYWHLLSVISANWIKQSVTRDIRGLWLIVFSSKCAVFGLWNAILVWGGTIVSLWDQCEYNVGLWRQNAERIYSDFLFYNIWMWLKMDRRAPIKRKCSSKLSKWEYKEFAFFFLSFYSTCISKQLKESGGNSVRHRHKPKFDSCDLWFRRWLWIKKSYLSVADINAWCKGLLWKTIVNYCNMDLHSQMPMKMWLCKTCPEAVSTYLESAPLMDHHTIVY